VTLVGLFYFGCGVLIGFWKPNNILISEIGEFWIECLVRYFRFEISARWQKNKPRRAQTDFDYLRDNIVELCLKNN
jgi:hypothetical protein